MKLLGDCNLGQNVDQFMKLSKIGFSMESFTTDFTHFFTANGYFPSIPSISGIFFFVDFLSRTFTIHSTAGEGGGHFVISSLPFHSPRRHLDVSQAITGRSSHSWLLDSSRKTLISERKSQTTKLYTLKFPNFLSRWQLVRQL